MLLQKRSLGKRRQAQQFKWGNFLMLFHNKEHVQILFCFDHMCFFFFEQCWPAILRDVCFAHVCIAVQEREDVGRVIIFSSPLHEAAKEGEKTLMSRKKRKREKRTHFQQKREVFRERKKLMSRKKDEKGKNKFPAWRVWTLLGWILFSFLFFYDRVSAAWSMTL